MVKFRITASREADRYPPSTTFEVEWISGRLEVGQRFVLFETHHQANFDVLEIEDRGDSAVVKASGFIPWDNQWQGAIVETEEPDILIEDDVVPNPSGLFDQLVTGVAWDDRMAARRTASCGRPYDYSQMSYPERPIHPELAPMVDLLESRLSILFNNCLLNYYESGENSMGFHSDRTEDLRPGTGVAIVSLGSVREITYRLKTDTDVRISYPLRPGSMLYMDEAVQKSWDHAIRRQRDAGPRLSLTWRCFQ